jgi:hypothetical protein
MANQSEKCRIKALHHPVKGIEFEFEGDCSEALKVIENLPPRRRRYFMRRVKIRD